MIGRPVEGYVAINDFEKAKPFMEKALAGTTQKFELTVNIPDQNEVRRMTVQCNYIPDVQENGVIDDKKIKQDFKSFDDILKMMNNFESFKTVQKDAQKLLGKFYFKAGLEKLKQGKPGGPYTNEAVGAENYGTLSYVLESPLEKGVIWTGSDDGLVHVTRDGGATWQNVTPKALPDFSLIGYVEPSHFDPAVCYISATKYKSDDNRPFIYKTSDYGATWTPLVNGLPTGTYVRCVREDPERKGNRV